MIVFQNVCKLVSSHALTCLSNPLLSLKIRDFIGGIKKFRHGRRNRPKLTHGQF